MTLLGTPVSKKDSKSRAEMDKEHKGEKAVTKDIRAMGIEHRNNANAGAG